MATRETPFTSLHLQALVWGTEADVEFYADLERREQAVMATQDFPDNGELDIEAHERPDAEDIYANYRYYASRKRDYLAREHAWCLGAARDCREHGEVKTAAEFLGDAAHCRHQLMIIRGYTRA